MAFTSSHIPLGPLDHIAPWNIPQSVIYLSLKHGITADDAFSNLLEGLRRTFQQIPWLNGRVYWQSEGTIGWRPGQLEIRYGALTESPPLRFNELNTDLSFADLKDLAFPLDTFKDEDLLRMNPFEPDFENGLPVLTAQANFLRGGCALVLSVAPPASDGTAMLSVTRVWADHCSSLMNDGRQLNGEFHAKSLSLPPLPYAGSERTILHGACKEAKVVECLDQTSFETCSLVGLDNGQGFSDDAPLGDSTAGFSDDMKPSLFYLPQAAYKVLRKECIAELGSTDVSGNDLICALIWKSVVRACTAVQDAQSSEERPLGAQSELCIPFDARVELIDLLPANYLGNLNFESRLICPIDYLVTKETSIPCLAKMIRTHTTKLGSGKSLLDAYTLLNSARDYKQVPQMRAPRMRLASVGILSPMMLPFNEACFGAQTFGNGGRPEAFRPLMGACNSGFRTCFVVPRKSHGGIEFVLTLSKQEMNFLLRDAEFNDYVLHMA
ncbi:transferase family protein [Penicillium sp. IBT 31633x]|nr:transferase family protein [Penicillium sp. IBT 31633x]